MDTSANNNIKAFTDAIKKMAAEECKKIDSETEEIREQRLSSLQSEVETQYSSFINYEKARIDADKNCRISALEENSKKILTDKRNHITEKVFDSVKQRILEFTASKDYKAYLVSLANNVKDEFGTDRVEFFVKPDDMKYADAIKSAVGADCTVSEASDIILGGLRAVDKSTNCLADSTIDLELNNRKEWFFEQSGLKI